MSGRTTGPLGVPGQVWQRPEMLDALHRRDVGKMLQLIQQFTGASQTQIGSAFNTTQGKVSLYMHGKERVEKLDKFEEIATGVGMPDEARMLLGLAPCSVPVTPRHPPQAAEPPVTVITPDTAHIAYSEPPNPDAGTGIAEPPDLHKVEALRQELHNALSEGMMADASLEDWERLVLRYGRATRDRPAELLLEDLSVDLTELKRTIQRHRSASAMRRLTHVAANMAGLMCLTLCKIDDRPGFRRWTRTARIAATEAGDPLTHSWVLAQEAYGHYYSGDLYEAVDVARHAQALVHSTPCVGGVLAAALEARAYAAMGRRQETREALGRAEDLTAQLHGDELVPSAFGYNEAQLRFHAGNAFTHLRDTKAALPEQDRALELCMPGDYTDWAMTRLDRAECLMYSDETADALTYATETVDSLTKAQRKGIITLRGHEILNTLPKQRQELPAARDFRELLMQTTETKGIEGS
jgi:tetratricopeptide (TPR) repeat protein